jgi:hypothetical protein
MDTAIIFGIFALVYGALYILFAFVAKENMLVNTFFRVPWIYFFLPENARIVAGRVITGLIMLGFGAFYIFYMMQYV